MKKQILISILLISNLSFSLNTSIIQEVNFQKYVEKKNEKLTNILNENLGIIKRSHLNNYNKYVVGIKYLLKDSTSIAVFFNNRWEIKDSTSFDCYNNKRFFQSKVQSIYVYTKERTYEYY